MIPHLLTWSPHDLAWLRTAIEEDSRRCGECKHGHRGTNVAGLPIRCEACNGSGVTHGHTQGIAVDWLLGRVQTCVHCCGTSSVVDPAIPITESWSDPLVTCPHCNGSGGERLPQWGVDSQMTEVLLLYARLGLTWDDGTPLPDHVDYGVSYQRASQEIGMCCPDFPHLWMLWLAERLAPGPSPCPYCKGTSGIQHQDFDGPYNCPTCRSSGTICPEAEMVERMRGWRVERDGQRIRWYVLSPGFSGTVYWDSDNTGYATQAEADRELTRRDLAQFAECGRTVECPVCHGAGIAADVVAYMGGCPVCNGSGKRIVRPEEFMQ